MRRTGLALVLTLCAAAWATGFAQAPGAPPAQTFRSGTELVQLDVSVLDKNHRPVHGLTAADFTVLDGGKERPIAVFSAVDVADPSPTVAPWVRDVAADAGTNALPNGRLVTILLDRSIPAGQPSITAKAIARSAIDHLGPNDLGAVALAVGGIQQTFTADHQRLLAALARRDAGTELSNDAVDQNAQQQQAYVANGGDPATLPTQSGACYCGLCTFEQITNISGALRNVSQRRKTLVFVGHTLDLQPSDIDCAQRVTDARTAMFRALQVANVTIYSFDPVGLETLAVGASSSLRGVGAAARGPEMRQQNQANQGALTALAEQTGGRAVLDVNEPESAMGDIYRENGSYYLLAFEPADPRADNRLRKVEVKVKTRGLTVRTRKGYYTTPDGEAAKIAAPATGVATTTGDAAIDAGLARSMTDLLPKSDLPLTVVAAPFAVAHSPTAAVVISLGVSQPIPAPQPGAAPAGSNERVDILTVAFDPRGRARLSHRQTLAIRVPPNVGSIRYEAFARLNLAPGRYEIRAAASTADRTGSVFVAVDVPDFAQEALSLSGLALVTSDGIDPAARTAVADVLPVTPTARRGFAPGAPIRAFARLYQGGAAPPRSATIVARVVDAANQPRFEQTATFDAARFDAARSADYSLDVPSAGWPAGDYLLTIAASAAGKTARRDVRFSLR